MNIFTKYISLLNNLLKIIIYPLLFIHMYINYSHAYRKLQANYSKLN